MRVGVSREAAAGKMKHAGFTQAHARESRTIARTQQLDLILYYLYNTSLSDDNRLEKLRKNWY
jgi:hypothetical protein